MMDYKVAFREESYKHSVPGETVSFDWEPNDIRCARNSFAAFQVLLETGFDCTLCLTDSPSFPVFPDRKQVRLESVVENLGKMKISLVTPLVDDNGTMRWDCIENGDYYTLGKNNAAVLWCEIETSPETVPGIYNGNFKIYERNLFRDEVPAASYAFEIEVMDISLPGPEDFRFNLDLWQHLSNIARKHDVRLFSDAHFRVVENYVKSLARLGQKNITVIASEIPWSGQRTFNDPDEPTDLFEYSMIRTLRHPGGTFTYDYSVMDRYIRLCSENGINGSIEVFGLCGIWMSEESGFGRPAPGFPDGVRVRYLDSATGCHRFMDEESQLRDFIHCLYEHFIEEDWLDRVMITADEPADTELYRKTMDIILEEGPLFKFSIAINKAEFTLEFNSVMSGATPSLRCLAEDYDFIRDNMLGKDGVTVSWYVCCRPHFPNTFLKSPLLESRLICLLTYYLGLDGFLRWNYTVWPENPRERIVFRSPEWPAGDMNFVYPGNDGNPLLSLRYKALLRGIEDYELAYLSRETESVRDFIETRIMKGTTLRQLSALGYDESNPPVPYSLDQRDYEDLRSLLYDLIASRSRR